MKLELNVVRMTNEDVIATSSNLTATTMCYKFNDTDGSGTLNDGDGCDRYDDGAKLDTITLTGNYASYLSLYNSYLNNAGTDLDFDKYYRAYKDENGKIYLYECNDHTHSN